MNPQDAKLAQTADDFLNLVNRDYGHNGPQNLTQLALIDATLKLVDRLIDLLPYGSFLYQLGVNIRTNLEAMKPSEEDEKARHGNVISVIAKHLHDLKSFIKRFRELAEFYEAHQHCNCKGETRQ